MVAQDNIDDPFLHLITLHQLPNKEFHGIMETIHLGDSRSQSLLNQVSQMMDLFRDGDIDPVVHNWDRLVLLHGPPGSGKTSLCRGLAQKLAIRGTNYYTSAHLLEINANAVHSKFFGESGKEVAKAFGRIYAVAEDPQTLVCVLVDEIETIAGSRKHAHDTNEVGDALRATNQLLTSLDKAHSYPNVLVLCTSNLVETIDPAFLNRVDIDKFIGNPSSSAAYEIIRSCMDYLIDKGKVSINELEIETMSDEGSENTVIPFEDDAESPPGPNWFFPRYFHAMQEGLLSLTPPSQDWWTLQRSAVASVDEYSATFQQWRW